MKRIGWDTQARAHIRAIDRANAMQVLQVIHRYAASGAGDVKKLQPPLSGLRLRAGDWRVFFTEPQPNAMRITGVYHRGRAYRG